MSFDSAVIRENPQKTAQQSYVGDFPLSDINIYPIDTDYSRINDLVNKYNISKDSAFEIIDKHKMRTFEIAYNYYPDYMSPENRANAFLMGYSPRTVSNMNPFKNDMWNSKLYSWCTNEWKDNKLMSLIKSHYSHEKN